MNKQACEQAFIRGFLKAADMMPQAPIGANNPPNQPQLPQIMGNSGGAAGPGQPGQPPIPGAGLAPQPKPAPQQHGLGGFSMNGGNGNIAQIIQQLMHQQGNGMKPPPQAIQSQHIA